MNIIQSVASCVLIVIGVGSHLLFAQGAPGLGESALQLDRLPPSPEASSFAKYGEYPVDMSTGAPGISIPLLSLSGRELSVNVGINYHGSGIKVSEVPSSVGLGWSLSGTGAVSRVVRGLPDESENGFLNHSLPDPSSLLLNQNSAELRNYASGVLDSQPDLFYYSMGGMSGQFVFDETGRAHTIPYMPLKISFDSDKGFEITDPSGVSYVFGWEKDGSDATETTRALGHSELNLPYISSWYLTMILSPNRTDTITYQYEEFSYAEFQTSFTESDVLKVNPYCGAAAGYSYQYVSTQISGIKAISSIESASGSIVFTNTGSSGRLDGGTHRLDKVEFYDSESVLQNGFEFTYDYFDSQASNANERRLKLESIQEFDKNNSTSSTNPYEFEYYDTYPYSLPARDSKDIDHWGYYNGATNSTLIPTTTIASTTYQGADREPSSQLQHTLAYTIKRIVYPTQGATDFEFEQNTYQLPSTQTVYYSIPFNHSIEVVGTYCKPIDNHGSSCVDNSPYCDLNSSEWDACLNDSYAEEEFVYNLPADQYGTVKVWKTTDSEVATLVTQSGTGYPTNHCSPTIRIYDQTGGTDVLLYTESSFSNTNVYSDISLYLESGHEYRIEGSGFCHPGISLKVEVHYSLETQQVITHSGITGGLRIKKISSYDDVQSSDPVSVKVYKYEDANGVSTGELVSPLPVYSSEMVYMELVNDIYDECPMIRLSSSNIHSVTGGSGNAVFYTDVTEYQGEDANTGEIGINGKTEYSFRLAYDTSPFQSESWQRGQPLTQTVYKKENGSYLKVSETINTYDFDGFASLARTIDAFTIEYKVIEGNTDYPIDFFAAHDIFGFYEDQVQSRAVLLSSTKERVYDPNGVDYLETTTDYSYENELHAQVTSQTITNSDGVQYVTEFVYPLDYFGDYSDLDDCYETYLTTLEVADATRRDCVIDRFANCESIWSQCLESYGDCLIQNQNTCMTNCGVPCSQISGTSGNCIDLGYGANWHHYAAFSAPYGQLHVSHFKVPVCVATYTSTCPSNTEALYEACLADPAYNCEDTWNTAVLTAGVTLNSCVDNFYASFNSQGLSPDEEALAEMLPHRKHILNTVIEQRNWIIIGSNKSLTSAQKSTFQLLPGQRVVPSKVWMTESGSPISEATFLASPSTYYVERAEYLDFDPWINPKTYQIDSHVPTSFLWGRNHLAAIAQVLNAESNQIAYTGFEEENPSIWSQGGWSVEESPQTRTRSVGTQETGPNDQITAAGSMNARVSVDITSFPDDVSYAFLSFEESSSGDKELVVPVAAGSLTYQEFSISPGTYSVELDCISLSGSGCSVNGAVELSYSWDTNSSFFEGFNHSYEAKVGARAYLLQVYNGESNQLEKSGLLPGEYTLTYWQKLGNVSVSVSGSGSVLSTSTLDSDANGWDLIEKTISISATGDNIIVSGTGILIDELRLHPSEAQMKSVCFDSSFRVNSQTDARNISVFFEYDDLGRLRAVIDHDGNIIKRMSYTYSN